MEQQASKVRDLEAEYAGLKREYADAGKAAEKAAKDVDAAFSKLKAAQAKQASLAAGIKGQFNLGPGLDTSAAYQGALSKSKEYQKTAAEVAQLKASLGQLHAAMSEAEVKQGGLGDSLKTTGASLAQERQELGRLSEASKKAGQMVSRVNKAFSAVKRLASAAARGVGSMGKAVAGVCGKLKTAVSRLGLFRRESGKGQGAAQGFSKAIIKLGTMLKMAVLRKAIQGMVTAAREGFENLSQYSTDCNGSMSALMSGMTQLKNSFATAFSPILSAVTPAITALISQLSKAITYVGMLFAALSGAKSFTRATAVNEDYAKSLKATGKAAKDTQNVLAGFDDLNVLGGNGSGGGGGGALDPAGMFEEVEIPSFVQDLTDLIKSRDWAGLGAYIANGINSGLSKLKVAVSWDNLGPAITNVVDGITGTFNSLVDNIDWAAMGQTLGLGINTLANTLFLLFTGIDWINVGSALALGINSMIATIDWYHLGETVGAYFSIALNTLIGFVQTFDWAGAGTALGTGLQGLFDFIDWDALGGLLAGLWNGVMLFISNAVTSFDWVGAALTLAGALNNMVSEIDWAATGQTISDFFTSALEFFTTAVETFDWYALGQDIKTLLVNIDWAKIIFDLSEAIGAALGGLAALCWGAIEDAVTAIGDYFKEKFHQYGDNIIAGLLGGILDAIAGIGNWISDNIFQPFITGFKNAFGIHSPSTVMENMGGFMIDGLKNGLTGLWDGVKGFFSDAVDGIKGFFSIDNLKSVGSNAVSGLMNGLKSVGSKVKDWGAGILGGIKDALGIHSPSTETEEVGEYTVAGYINGLEQYTSKLGTALGKFSKLVLDMFSDTADTVLERQGVNQGKYTDSLNTWTGSVEDLFTRFYANLTTQADNWALGLQNTLNGMITAAKSAANSISSQLSSARSNSASLSTLRNGANASTARATAARVSEVQSVAIKVPAYATGAVLPANHPHLAIVGDQRSGTNVEAPLAAIEEAVDRALDRRSADSEIIYELREIRSAIREGKVFMVGDAEIGRAVQKSLASAARANGSTAIPIR